MESSPHHGAAVGPFANSTCCRSGEGGSGQQVACSQHFWETRKDLARFHTFWGSKAQVLAVGLGKALGAAGEGRTGRAAGLSSVGRALAAPLAKGRRLKAGECGCLAMLCA